jgi:hypothetical protein
MTKWTNGKWEKINGGSRKTGRKVTILEMKGFPSEWTSLDKFIHKIPTVSEQLYHFSTILRKPKQE